MKGAIIIAVGITLAGLAIAAAIYFSPGEQSSPRGEPLTATSESPSSTPTSSATPSYVLTGTVVFDGVTEGCGGEDMLVSIRKSGQSVASNVAHSAFQGFDCVVPIELPVPRLRCYELWLDQQPVGYYHLLDLRANNFSIGYISSDSVYGNVYNDYQPRPFADRGFPC